MKEYVVLVATQETATQMLRVHADIGWLVHTANMDDADCFIFLLERDKKTKP